jgi:hypothetical protein
LLDELAKRSDLPIEKLSPRSDLPELQCKSEQEADHMECLFLGFELDEPHSVQDLVSDTGAGLRKVFDNDLEVQRKVREAIEIFGGFERKTMEFVRSGRVDIEWDGRTL